MDFKGVNCFITMPNNVLILANSAKSFFLSGFVSQEYYKLALPHQRYLIWGRIESLLAENKPVPRLFIDDTFDFWAITQ
jgi:hypothetical protein